MKPISEPEIQIAVAGLLNRHPELSQVFLRAVNPAPDDCVSPITCLAEHSAWSPNGETDIVLTIQNEQRRYKFLIELKLAAHFQIAQGSRYKDRVGAMREDGVVHSILLAPQRYFTGANPEARHFDFSVALEEFLSCAEKLDRNSAAVELIGEAIERLTEGKPLGAKGLFEKLYLDVAEECDRRANSLRILNRATEWMSLKHPDLPTGVNLNYRIKSGVSEIRVLSSYRGDRAKLEQPEPPLLPNTLW